MDGSLQFSQRLLRLSQLIIHAHILEHTLGLTGNWKAERSSLRICEDLPDRFCFEKTLSELTIR